MLGCAKPSKKPAHHPLGHPVSKNAVLGKIWAPVSNLGPPFCSQPHFNTLHHRTFLISLGIPSCPTHHPKKSPNSQVHTGSHMHARVGVARPKRAVQKKLTHSTSINKHTLLNNSLGRTTNSITDILEQRHSRCEPRTSSNHYIDAAPHLHNAGHLGPMPLRNCNLENVLGSAMKYAPGRRHTHWDNVTLRFRQDAWYPQ
jgi:hypothetical protein